MHNAHVWLSSTIHTYGYAWCICGVLINESFIQDIMHSVHVWLSSTIHTYRLCLLYMWGSGQAFLRLSEIVCMHGCAWFWECLYVCKINLVTFTYAWCACLFNQIGGRAIGMCMCMCWWYALRYNLHVRVRIHRVGQNRMYAYIRCIRMFTITLEIN